MLNMVRSLSVKHMEPGGTGDAGGVGGERPKLQQSMSVPAGRPCDEEGNDVNGNLNVQQQTIEEQPPTEERPQTPAIYLDPDPQEMSKMRYIFDFLDENHDGTISRHEYTRGVRYTGLNPTRDEVDKFWRDGGVTDDNKGLDFEGYVKSLSKGARADAERERIKLTEAFRFFDTEGKGYISTDDIINVTSSIGDPFTTEESEEFMRKIDKNGDGIISYDEFVEEMCSNVYL